MDQVPLRELHPIEVKLHKEMLDALDQLVASEGLTEAGRPSSKVLLRATKTSEFFEAIGFVLTNRGVMARVELDIFYVQRDDLIDARETGWARVESAMRRGPSA